MSEPPSNEKPTCHKCGVVLTDANWYESHRNPRPRYLSNLGKFYALRLFICKECWKRRSSEAGKALRQRQKELDPENINTRYRGTRLAWRGNFTRKMTGAELRTISAEAERVTATEILPREGFEDICWLHNHHAPFDILARKGSERYLIDVTTASYKSFMRNCEGNRLAVDWLSRNLPLFLLVVFVSPDLRRYVMKEIPSARSWVGVSKGDLVHANPIQPERP